jgi:hypothetical protein
MDGLELLTLSTVFDGTTGDGEQAKKRAGTEQQNGRRNDEGLNNDRLATWRRGERMRGVVGQWRGFLGSAAGCNAYSRPVRQKQNKNAAISADMFLFSAFPSRL